MGRKNPVPLELRETSNQDRQWSCKSIWESSKLLYGDAKSKLHSNEFEFLQSCQVLKEYILNWWTGSKWCLPSSHRDLYSGFKHWEHLTASQNVSSLLPFSTLIFHTQVLRKIFDRWKAYKLNHNVKILSFMLSHFNIRTSILIISVPRLCQQSHIYEMRSRSMVFVECSLPCVPPHLQQALGDLRSGLISHRSIP